MEPLKYLCDIVKQEVQPAMSDSRSDTSSVEPGVKPLTDTECSVATGLLKVGVVYLHIVLSIFAAFPSSYYLTDNANTTNLSSNRGAGERRKPSQYEHL